jgi:hypothetical protein
MGIQPITTETCFVNKELICQIQKSCAEIARPSQRVLWGFVLFATGTGTRITAKAMSPMNRMNLMRMKMQKKCKRCGSYSEEKWMEAELCHSCNYDDYEETQMKIRDGYGTTTEEEES